MAQLNNANSCDGAATTPFQEPHPNKQQPCHQKSKHMKLSTLPRVGSAASMSSISSLSSYHSTKNGQEIFENVVNCNDARSTHSSSHCHTNDINESIEDMHNLTLTPSPKRTSPQNSPQNTQNDTISALTKLYTNNLNVTHLSNKELSPSPRDNAEYELNEYQTQNVQHQDLKHQQNLVQSKNTKSKQKIFSIQNALWSGLRYIANTKHSDSIQQNDNDSNMDEDEKKYPQSGHIQNSALKHIEKSNEIQSIIQSPKFMDNAIAMYGHLDAALNNIQTLQSEHMHKLKNRKKKKRKKVHKKEAEEVVVDTMKTLLCSTSEMGSFFVDNENESTSLIGSLLDRLSSSIAYFSYISVSTITPFLYNMVEAVLLELYSTIKDVIKYYDPDPKNNVLWRVINKMNEIIEALRGLMALSRCFYEITSDEEEQQNDNNHDNISYSIFSGTISAKKKEKKD